MHNKVTIKDIAKLAGVSTATVSHYINHNYSKMSAETQKKLEKIIEMTDYKPSNIAISLAKNFNKSIGVVIADITNPFITSVMKGINDYAYKKGYSVVFTNSDNDVENENENIKRLNQQNLSGIVIDPVLADNPFLETQINKNMIMIDRQSSIVKMDTVVSDNEACVYRFIQLMLEKGYQDIYFVSFPLENISTRLTRYKGFQNAMHKTDDENLIIYYNHDQFRRTIEQAVKKNALRKAFFTVNGPALLHLMQVIQELGYSYPNDFGVGSYEDLDWMEVLNPGISCIRQDSYKMGVAAAQRLIDRIENKALNEPALIEIKTSIVLRDSF